MTDTRANTAGMADAQRAIPARHPLRWVAVVVLAVLVAALATSFVTNRRFQWDVIGNYLFSRNIVDGVARTLELTAICMAIGIVVGTLVAVGRLSPNPVLAGAAWVYIWVFRGTPVLVQLILWFNLAALYPELGVGIPGQPLWFEVNTNQLITPLMAAILGLSLNEAAYMAEIVRSGILSVDEGQTEAGLTIGMTRLRVLRRIVLPQAIRVIIPNTGNQLIGLLKYTSLVSVLAVPDLLYSAELVYQQNYKVVPLLLVAAIWYLVITSLLMFGQYYLERHFARGSVRTLPLTLAQRLRGALSRRFPAVPRRVGT